MEVAEVREDAGRRPNGARPRARATGAPSSADADGGRRENATLERQAIAAAKRGDWDGIRAARPLRGRRARLRAEHRPRPPRGAGHHPGRVHEADHGDRQVRGARGPVRPLDHARRAQRHPRPPPGPVRQIPVEEVRVQRPRSTTSRASIADAALKEALAALPEEQRTVLVMRHIAGLSPEEIAERLGKTESSIHGLHHRGRAALQGVPDRARSRAGHGRGLASRRRPRSPGRGSRAGDPTGVDVRQVEQRSVLE